MARKQSGDPEGKGRAMRDQIASSQRQYRRENRHKGEYADYTSVDPELLRGAIVAVTGKDCAIQFGYTKDGSTFVVRIVGDGEPYNDFVRPSEDVDAYFKALCADFTDER